MGNTSSGKVFTPTIEEIIEKIEEPRDVDCLEKVAKIIAQSNHIVVITGAGLSTESGISDFRTKSSGLYDNLQKFNLPNPTAIFDLDFFKQDPYPFYALAKELIGKEGQYLPNTGHYFIRLLEQHGKLLRNFTQNIDGLEFKTGIDRSKVVQCHGTFETATCLNCSTKYSLDFMKQCLGLLSINGSTKEEIQIPKCNKCDGIVKSDVVFFGEDLPESYFQHSKSDLQQCDCILVMGTSLAVYPVASLPNKSAKGTPKVMLNRERGGVFTKERMDENDYFVGGNIGESCLLLCEKLGWEKELHQLQQKNT